MALTPSTMLPLGTALPFAAITAELEAGHARQVSGEPLQPQTLAQGPLLVLFICAHCPFVKHVEPEITRLQADFASRAAHGPAEPQPTLALLAISSNSTATHPQDGPEGLRAQAERQGWRFPYLYDGRQALARAFRAACTPDPFLFAPAADGVSRLVYRGQFDASRPGNDSPLDGRDIRAAIAAVLAGEPVAAEQRPAIGCNIKWHPGEEPEWAR
ncbi:thioredoxin family protein [Cyanobium sp. CH-040]|uniref:thioredoxin family protein n=1 Tax=Cyanobium sp. CH-040 TaxID=2823708 RepID=UPI0020CBA819|nr:thioredoxin family protein [Cyanobium sp. CH-040]MCP9928304.1 thioredoxin family protein [Cyanobium sp. CH-040]